MHILTLVHGIRKKLNRFTLRTSMSIRLMPISTWRSELQKLSFFMTSNTNYIELVGHFFHFINYSSTQEILKGQVTIHTYYLKPS